MKKLLTSKKETNKGITLIALIITIIVLLILTGVTIATLTGENGILTQAKNAKKEMTKAEAKERIQLEVLGSYGTDGEIDIATLKANIAKNIPEAVIGEETELPLTVTVGDYTFTVKANGTVEEETATTGGNEAVVGKIVTGDNKPYTKNGKAIIPVGFAIVPGLDDVSEGLVISDVANDTENAGNQFVWIPVTKENPFERRAGYGYNGNLQDISNYGEPDASGSNSIVTESEETQAEAIAMYASVQSNGGFYIGRYEAGVEGEEPLTGESESESESESGSGSGSGAETGITRTVLSKKGAYPNNYIIWDEAVELARNFVEQNNYDTTKVHSTLCYGVQWDTALNFIDPGYTGYAKDSIKMGWYNSNSNSTSGGNIETNPEFITGKDLIYTSEVGSIPAGEPTNKHKNIYDMAGNVYEWTMEATNSTNRVVRLGRNLYDYKDSVSGRSERAPGASDRDTGFRITLFL